MVVEGVADGAAEGTGKNGRRNALEKSARDRYAAGGHVLVDGQQSAGQGAGCVGLVGVDTGSGEVVYSWGEGGE